MNLAADEFQRIISYARQKYSDERFPFSPALRPLREALAKLDPQPKREPRPEPKPYVPSSRRSGGGSREALSALLVPQKIGKSAK